MTPEWPILLLFALGHGAILVYVTNVVHGLGFTDSRMKKVKRIVLLTVLAATIALAWELSRGPLSSSTWFTRAYAIFCLGVILVGVPLSTWRIRSRRHPADVVERLEECVLALPGLRDEFIGPGAHAWLLKIPCNETFHLRRREGQLTLPGLPASWDGLSVVHLTDLHFAPCFKRRYFERVVEEAASWDADLLVFTGDLIDHDEAIDWIVPVMSTLRGRHGTLGILGNHDYDHHPSQIRRRLEESGFTDLEGRWDRIELRGKTLAVGGTSYPWGPDLDLDAARDTDFRLLLSHTPDLFYRAAASGVDLMLSGHNHGGQIRLPLVGPVFMPSRYSRRLDRGYFRSGRTLMHVSQGVAGKHPIRFGCVPEISRFILRKPRGPLVASRTHAHHLHEDQSRREAESPEPTHH